MLFRKMPLGEKLHKKCEKNRVSFDSAATDAGIDDSIMQRRWLEFLKARRESWTFLIVLLSGLASVFSALAAWYAVSR